MNAAVKTDFRVPVLGTLFRFQWEPAQQAYVLLYPEGMVKLNQSAGEILALVDGQRNVTAISAALMEKFPEAGDLSGDILEFLEVAREQRWIDYR
ncbi:pyrroloquinoline quinone biosynthesis peptide chaperone PqqD [Marinobacterium sp. D7]|uniref:PqqA binding protein n=1 Tax=Marinobacterium zhoushanense TaxID=1679163 RepID=A0ABQ1KA84_9GAMM|nr:MULTISPECIES: pyrroloquinoline quinone biosynthesis peptide chaperone PqqD [Marinobacterium]MBV1789883.1 pyrroloquinoline quinone biosynthesis peptide chaperone PqqD [Marinobacterium ramblicola]GGB93043.1 coenzyme PQQ synthesis protein D [Marinobacterium zhoushanense]